ncbi:MAG: GatB/YqeY domain-containing protein [Deltaproteobacteria bacterium]|nr:GatB/YqeY domain-containing protein [Deltaproteobacteria bacterium]MBF0525389.1 GatB/YqeY domain-containing protein [Deltaproteobacteria bacterium]
MPVIDDIDHAFKSALKSSDKIRLSTLRMARAAIKNKEVELRRKLSDQEIIATLNTMAKQRQESIAQFSLGGRQDLVDQETQELEIIFEFLPKQLSEAEVAEAVTRIIRSTGAYGKKDLGKVMKAVMAELAGQADGKLVNRLVSEKINK